VTVFATALLGVFFIGSALQGYVTGIGVMRGGILGHGVRISLFVAGLAFASPGNVGLGLGHFHMAGLGLVLSLPALLDTWLTNRRGSREQHV
jgi:hypothetical protein